MNDIAGKHGRSFRIGFTKSWLGVSSLPINIKDDVWFETDDGEVLLSSIIKEPLGLKFNGIDILVFPAKYVPRATLQNIFD